MNLPKVIKHPAGFSISGAPVGTFLRSALLIAGRKALGNRYGGSPFYEMVERDLAFGIMRSHFHHGYPKGTHCCVQCTLAVYPVLEVGAIRYFDCTQLATNLRRLIQRGGWRFTKPANARLTRWALGEARTIKVVSMFSLVPVVATRAMRRSGPTPWCLVALPVRSLILLRSRNPFSNVGRAVSNFNSARLHNNKSLDRFLTN